MYKYAYYKYFMFCINFNIQYKYINLYIHFNIHKNHVVIFRETNVAYKCVVFCDNRKRGKCEFVAFNFINVY